MLKDLKKLKRYDICLTDIKKTRLFTDRNNSTLKAVATMRSAYRLDSIKNKFYSHKII